MTVLWSPAHFPVAYRPASQMVTDPPPYSPAVIVPANAAYSSGWSSVGTASRRGALPPGGALLRRRALRHRPALQDAVALQPEIPVHALTRAAAWRVVLLDHEGVVVALRQHTAGGWNGLGGPCRIPLGAVLGERGLLP